MKKIILLFCLLQFNTHAQGTKATSYEVITLKFSLHELFDPFNPSVSWALEYKPSHQIGLQAELGYRFYPAIVTSERSQERYLKAKLRASCYYHDRKKSNLFTGIDLLYLPKHYDLNGGL